MSTSSKEKGKEKYTNNSSNYSIQNEINNKSEIMFRKKGFIHHYIREGLDEAEVIDALNNYKDLINEYELLNSNYKSDINEEVKGM